MNRFSFSTQLIKLDKGSLRDLRLEKFNPACLGANFLVSEFLDVNRGQSNLIKEVGLPPFFDKALCGIGLQLAAIGIRLRFEY
jgi:hypothetical protein